MYLKVNSVRSKTFKKDSMSVIFLFITIWAYYYYSPETLGYNGISHRCIHCWCDRSLLWSSPGYGSRSGSRSPLPWSWKPPAAQLKELTCYQLKETVLSSSSSDQTGCVLTDWTFMLCSCIVNKQMNWCFWSGTSSDQGSDLRTGEVSFDSQLNSNCIDSKRDKDWIFHYSCSVIESSVSVHLQWPFEGCLFMIQLPC